MSGELEAAPVSVERRGESIEVAGRLTLDTALQAMAAAQECFKADAPSWRIDLGNLQETDSAALAVLLEWLREAGRRRRTVEYVHVPERLMQLAEISELEDVLGFSRSG